MNNTWEIIEVTPSFWSLKVFGNSWLGTISLSGTEILQWIIILFLLYKVIKENRRGR